MLMLVDVHLGLLWFLFIVFLLGNVLKTQFSKDLPIVSIITIGI